MASGVEYSEADEEGESNASMKIGDTANGDDFTEGTSRERRILFIIINRNSRSNNSRVRWEGKGEVGVVNNNNDINDDEDDDDDLSNKEEKKKND